MTDDDQAVLPGLEEAPRSASALELGARRTLRALDELGLLDDRHALLCQLVVDLAQAVDSGRRAHRASAAAMAAAQLLAAIDRLPEPEVGGETDEWTQLADDLRTAAANAIRDREAAVLDAPEPGSTE